MIRDVERFTDFKKRDGKKGPYDGSAGVMKLFTAVAIKLPVLALVTPIAILSSIVGKLPLISRKIEASDLEIQPVESAKDRSPRADRKYDLVLMGATSFAGALAAKYLAKQYGSKSEFTWALAGRSLSKLKKVRDEIVEIDAGLADIDLIVADTSDEMSIDLMVNSTRVVITTVGPYAKFGTPLVASCVRYGTDYCDLTGEVSWMRETIEAFESTARSTGAKIVHMCGHDCIPWDLSTQALAKKIKEVDAGEELSAVEFYDDVAGTMSGGTVATIIHHMDNPMKPKTSLKFNALDMKADGSESNCHTSINMKKLGYSELNKTWYSYFLMSSVNQACVRRSNALNGYGSNVSYKEQQVLPGFSATITWLISSILGGLLLGNPLLRKFALATGLLPSPGEGPSLQMQEDGFLVVTGYGIGSKGTKVKSQFYFPKDPGYRDTARMIVESGLCMVLNRAELPSGKQGGIFTPATALGSVLGERLLKTGSEFEIAVLP
mmetsp:Transcript_3027/g.6943  ORF Transcript_3027/g.6943 Transcript_3027/m.6943 type:complete len:493 (+) Transcript_3027:134-1612(+)